MGSARRNFSAVQPSDRSRIQKRQGKRSPAATPHQKPSSSSSSSPSSSYSFSSRTGRTAAAGQVLPARQSGGSGGKAAQVGSAAEGGAEEGSRTFPSAGRQEKEDQDTKTQRRGISCVSSPQVGVTGWARRSGGGAVAVAEEYRSSRLFVRGLPPFVSAAELKERFSSLGGEVTDVCLLVTEKGRSRQCAFVGFKTQAQAAAAKQYFDSSFFYTRRIAVEFALPKHAAATDAAAAFSSSRRRTEGRAGGGARGAAAVADGEAPAARGSKKGGRTSTAAAAAETEGASGSGSSIETKPQQGRQKRSRRAGSGENGKAVAGGVIVQEEAVQAKKAGVGSVRKRLIFDDFFSSSDEEEEAAAQQEGEGGGAVGGSEGQGNGSSRGPPQQKNAARKRAKCCAEASAEAAVGSGNESSSATDASSERAAAGNDNAAAGVMKVAAAAAENGKRGRKTSRGDGGENDASSAGVLDDMAWLRQQSAAAQAAATQAREEEREAGAGGAAAKTEGELGEAAEGRPRDGGAGAAVAACGGEAVEATTAEEGTKRKTEEALALLGVHGRLLLRNFPYATTQEELKALCEQHGEVAEVHLVHDEETRKSKGYAFVTFVFPEHAVVALAKLDGMIFQGRLLQTEAAQPDAKKELRQQQRERQAAQKGSSSSYKRKKQQELLQQHTENQAFLEEKVWNLLYVSANAAVDAVAREFQVDKEELLGVGQPRKKKADDLSAAAKVALAETHLLQATREWIVKEGISAKAFERRGPTLLAAGVATKPSSGARTDRSNSKEGNYGSNKETAATSGQRQREEEEEEASSMGRSRDTLIVKHLPTAHVVGAELLRMFEAVGTVVRFLLAPSKTVAIVQYEKERDAAAAFRRLAYRKYKTVPLFIEKAPVDIFVGEEEQRRHAQMEAAAEASAATHADALAAGRHTGQKGQSGVCADRRSREGEGEEGGVARGGDDRQKIVVNGEAGGGEGTCTLGRKKKASITGDRKGTREEGGKTGDAEDAVGCGVCTRRSAGGGLPGSGEAAAEEEEEEHTDGLRGNSLFVKNLNFCTTEAALHEVFSGCTGLRSVKLMSKKRPVNKRSAEEHGTEDRSSLRENAGASCSGSNAGEFETLSLGYAFVEFDSAANATAACKRMQGVVVDAHTLKISISKSAPQRRYNGSSLVAVGGAAAGARPSAAAATANGRGTVKSRKLLVRNLAFQATTADLRGLFSAYGNVTRVCIPTQHEGRSRGFGFVEFATRPEAAAALQALSGTHLYGRKLVLEPALQETQGVGKN